MEADNLKNKMFFFNMFKNNLTKNMGLVHGFPNWASRTAYRLDGDDLYIQIPFIVVKRNESDDLKKSRRKGEIDKYMGSKNYRFLDYIIKLTISDYVCQNVGNRKITFNKKDVK